MRIRSHFTLQKSHSLFLVVIIIFCLLFYWLSSSGYREILANSTALRNYIESLGSLGPILIIVLMTMAIIMSPIPSAPIALVSGALYGHTWGTLYVLIGSTLGAISAFWIARLLGYDVLQRWFGGKLAQSWVGSQTTLMGIVFFSRLLPFISFDIVSYAAGLTSLTFWRFALATVAGIAPASFLLAHFGGELASTETQRITIAVLVLGLLTALPLLYKFLKNRTKKKLP